MELQIKPGEKTQQIVHERQAVGMVNGQPMIQIVPVNETVQGADIQVIRDPDAAKLTTIQITAQIQALEGQIQALEAANGQLQLKRAEALAAGKSTKDLAVQAFDNTESISTYRAMIEGLKLDFEVARQREKISELERVTASILGMKNEESKAYDHLMKSLNAYREIVKRFDRERQEYECVGRDLQHTYHLSQEQIAKHGQKTLVDEFSGNLDAKRTSWRDDSKL